MNLASKLVDEVLSRPHLQVCRGGNELVDRWVPDHPELRLIIGSGPRVVDVSHSPAQARVLTPEMADEPFFEEELARPYLRHVFDAQRPRTGLASKRVPFKYESLQLLTKLAPRLHVARPTEGSWTYVDITSAYPSIYGPLTLDCHYRPEQASLSLGRFDMVDFDQVQHWKPMQRAIGGIFRAREMRVRERGGKTETHKTTGWSQFLCPDLWGVIMDTMHSVAAEAERRGAVLWDTDGGIMPTKAAPGFRQWCSEVWQLETHDRLVGEAIVWGLKHWRVGDVETLQPNKRQLPPERHIEEPSLACRRTLIRVRDKRLELGSIHS
ncbi:MAG: hypothetical protein M0Z88_03980 [Actinomycetota bacterium]|nr:hypothetical protein [Actinomycetota bacterium]